MSSGEGGVNSGGAAGGAPSKDINNKKDPTDGPKRQQRYNNGQRFNVPSVPKQVKFEGKCDALKGHIYDCSSDGRFADMYAKTTLEIAEYVGRTYSTEMRIAVETLRMPIRTEPNDPPAGATKTQERIWQKLVDDYVKQGVSMRDNLGMLFSLVWGQCTDIMRQKIMALNTYEAMSATGDGLGLLRAIKDMSFNFQSQKYVGQSLVEAKRTFFKFYQSKTSTTRAYLDSFQSLVDVIEHCGGTIGEEPGLERYIATEAGLDILKLTPVQAAAIKKASKERFLATAFMLGADKLRFGRLIEDLENDHIVRGKNNFPVTLAAAYTVLTTWKMDPRNLVAHGPANDGVSFTNVGDGNDGEQEQVALTNNGNPPSGGKKDKSHITCHKCKKKGHYANECPEECQTGATLLMDGVTEGEFDQDSHFQFSQHGVNLKTGPDGDIPKTWILLDNQSTVDVFHNPALLQNIRENTTSMNIKCNAGMTTTKMVGDLPGYGTVWYYPNGIANILSLARVEERGYQVVYDSKDGHAFRVHKADGSVRTFNKSERGLFYMDTDGNAEGITLINTVANNRSNYTNRDYSRAVLARQIQKTIGRPSTRAFISIVENHLLPNCPIMKQDIVAAEHIFGRDIGTLKGKTVRHTAPRVEGYTVDIPSTVMSQYRNVILAGDIMFVNKIAFFMTISRHIKFGTAEMILDQKNKTILTAIKQVKSMYMRRGFIIQTLLMDGQFESLRGDIADLQITLNTVSNDEHVPDIEQYIRTTKERARCVYNTLPFRRLPARLIIEIVYSSIFWLNCFPPNDGISPTLSPRAIIVGTQIDYAKHCKLEFGTYVQTHEDHDNTMATRTTGAIALRPTGNEQGGYFFFSLTTGRVLNRNRWTTLPMPAEVIDRVHALARRSAAGLTIADRLGNPIVPLADEDDADDDDDDSDYQPPDEGDDDDFDDDDNAVDITGVYHNDADIAGVHDNEHADIENHDDDDNKDENYHDANEDDHDESYNLEDYEIETASDDEVNEPPPPINEDEEEVSILDETGVLAQAMDRK